MNKVKLLTVLFSFTATFITYANAQDSVSRKEIFSEIDVQPTYPGGNEQFKKYIAKNLEYPVVARILGMNGSVILSFIVEPDGKISTVRPLKCMGAGCESEAERVIENSKPWSPGYQNNRRVRVYYTIPINFGISNNDDNIRLNSLKDADFGFLFFIKGKVYTIDDAKTILGKSFDPKDIVDAEPYDNKDYAMPNKKAVYLVVMNPAKY